MWENTPRRGGLDLTTHPSIHRPYHFQHKRPPPPIQNLTQRPPTQHTHRMWFRAPTCPAGSSTRAPAAPPRHVGNHIRIYMCACIHIHGGFHDLAWHGMVWLIFLSFHFLPPPPKLVTGGRRHGHGARGGGLPHTRRAGCVPSPW